MIGGLSSGEGLIWACRDPIQKREVRMGHVMKTATVRDLRYHFSEIESRLREGEEVEIRKRRQTIARLLPVRPRAGTYPDFSRPPQAALRGQNPAGEWRPAPGTGARPLLNAYADTSFLVSLYTEDANSAMADSLIARHQPTFLLSAFGKWN